MRSWRSTYGDSKVALSQDDGAEDPDEQITRCRHALPPFWSLLISTTVYTTSVRIANFTIFGMTVLHDPSSQMQRCARKMGERVFASGLNLYEKQDAMTARSRTHIFVYGSRPLLRDRQASSQSVHSCLRLVCSALELR